MNLETGGFGVSTDVGGVLGGPKAWKEAWAPAMTHERFLGFEMLGWKWMNPLLTQASEQGCNIIGIHGRTGGVNDTYGLKDRIVLGTLNRILINTPELVTHGHEVGYVLIHAPEARVTKNLAAIVGNDPEHKPTVKRLFVENHIRTGRLGSAKEVAQYLNGEGVSTGVMIDLVHLMNAYDHRNSFADQWRFCLPLVQKTFEEFSTYSPDIKLGLHVPVGTKIDDSLPLDQITPAMWQDLTSIIHTRSDAIVIIENQQEGRGSIRASQKSLRTIRSRNEMIIDVLGENGVLG